MAALRKHARICARVSAFLLVACIATGCSFIGSELNNRGGYIDQKLDEHWMVADTKQMRLLRAYVLIGSFARLSREGYYRSERENLIQHVNSAVNVANEAFVCAYSLPAHCAYFDERMAEMEVAVLKLALAVLTKHENESLFSSLSKEMSESLPLLKAADSAAKLVEAFESSASLATSGLKIVKSIVTLGSTSYQTGRRLGALYRDSIELNMLAVLGSLRYQCEWQQGAPPFANDANRAKAISVYYADRAINGDACSDYNAGLDIWKHGSGNLSDWKNYLTTVAARYRDTIIPDVNAFSQASDLIWRACEHITDEPELLAKCIGRRPKNEECGCRLATEGVKKRDNCDVLMFANLDSGQQKELQTLLAEKNRLPQGHLIDSCPLIEFSTTWQRRNRKLENSSARLDFLSMGPAGFIPRRVRNTTRTPSAQGR